MNGFDQNTWKEGRKKKLVERKSHTQESTRARNMKKKRVWKD